MLGTRTGFKYVCVEVFARGLAVCGLLVAEGQPSILQMLYRPQLSRPLQCVHKLGVSPFTRCELSDET